MTKPTTLYVCGPTLYSDIHIGNARSLVFFDVLAEHLRRTTGVFYVRNITDIDDKIFKLSGNASAQKWVTENTLPQFRKDCSFLQLKSPDIEPRASEYVESVREDNDVLVRSGMAYYDGSGSSYFDTNKSPKYGEVSGRKPKGSFALWKSENSSVSSYIHQGNHPAWHGECSAMIREIFKGEGVDIHGGGVDLVFPHHENENAIHKGVTGNPVASEWVRVGLIGFKGAKMSKSSGNIITVKELSEDWSGPTIRTALLMSMYSKPFEWSLSRLKEAEKLVSKDILHSWPNDTKWSEKMVKTFKRNYYTRLG